MIMIRNSKGYKRPKRFIRKFEGESKTQTQFGEDHKTDVMIKKFLKTGRISVQNGPLMAGMDGASYHENMNRLVDIEQAFMKVPSEIRDKFQNDPGHFMDFVNDEKNYDECVKLGILEPKKAQEPQKVQVVNSEKVEEPKKPVEGE